MFSNFYLSTTSPNYVNPAKTLKLSFYKKLVGYLLCKKCSYVVSTLRFSLNFLEERELLKGDYFRYSRGSNRVYVQAIVPLW